MSLDDSPGDPVSRVIAYCCSLWGYGKRGLMKLFPGVDTDAWYRVVGNKVLWEVTLERTK